VVRAVYIFKRGVDGDERRKGENQDVYKVGSVRARL